VKRKKVIRHAAVKVCSYLLPFTFYLFPCRCAADGLSTPFADVQVDGVPVGKPFSVKGSTGNGLVLRNLGNTSLHVHVAVLQPESKDLRGGAVPIPDIRWVHVEPDHFDLSAHGEGGCRVTLRVPARKAYRGKYYQATLWSRSQPADGQGVAFSAGLLSRLRFRTR
jgi:hypothetical protein